MAHDRKTNWASIGQWALFAVILCASVAAIGAAYLTSGAASR
jgi:hypothetical protein